MNYRHAYHAGNFADVLKHWVLVLILEHLKQKPAPFRVIDTHAGIGCYDLSSIEAQKTGEWLDGIGRLYGPGVSPALAETLAPYLALVDGLNPDGDLRLYPGSPLIAQALMRPTDQLIANELHPADRETLEETLAGAGNAKVLGLDAWVALKSLLPPKERRGLILVDPPFEEPGELDRLVTGLAAAVRRFATGIYMLWYPIKDLGPIDTLHARLSGLDLPKMIAIDVLIDAPDAADGFNRLNGCGLVIVNPPFGLLPQIARALPELTAVLARAPGGDHRIANLGSEMLAIDR